MMKSSTDSAKVTKKIKDYKMKDWLFFTQILLVIITIGTFIYNFWYILCSIRNMGNLQWIMY